MHHRAPSKFRRYLDRYSVPYIRPRRGPLCLASSRPCQAAAPRRVFPLDLEMVRLKSRFRKRRCRQVRPRQVRFHPRQYLLSRNEVAFLRVLVLLVGHRYLISCKVRLADIINCSDADWKRGHANRIAQKHVDFVVSCARSSRIVAAIELDDLSHQRPDRRERDQFVNRLFSQMRVRLIRVPARWEYDRDGIANYFSEAGLNLWDGD